jgi:hypothetical protein
MSVNKDLPHVLVLPEDDANSQMATGFQLQLDPARMRQMQVLPVAGGWIKALDHFNFDLIAGMDRYQDRFMVLLIDFDGREERLQDVMARIPEQLKEPVFVLGTLSEPEDLRRAGLGSYEKIGSALAQDCRDQTDTIWGHDLLRHNANELVRLNEHLRPILFASN